MIVDSPIEPVVLTGLHDETITVNRAGAYFKLLESTNCRVIIEGLIGNDAWPEWLTVEDWDANTGPLGIGLTGSDNTVEFRPGGSIQGRMNGMVISGERNTVIGSPGSWSLMGQWGDHIIIKGDDHEIIDLWMGAIVKINAKHIDSLQKQARNHAGRITIDGMVFDRLQGMPDEYPFDNGGGGAMQIAGLENDPATQPYFVIRNSALLNTGDVAARFGWAHGEIDRLVISHHARIGIRAGSRVTQNGVIKLGRPAALAIVAEWRGKTGEPIIDYDLIAERDLLQAELADRTRERDGLQVKIDAALAALNPERINQ